MSTLYQPQHPSGDVGPRFTSQLLASVWLSSQAYRAGWMVAVVSDKPPLTAEERALASAYEAELDVTEPLPAPIPADHCDDIGAH